MNVYSIDVRVYATAYIKADSAEEAQQIAEGLKDNCLQDLEGFGDDGLEISGASYHELPADVTLSPAMSIHGPDEGDTVELVEEKVGEEPERLLLHHGSAAIMHAGMQRDWQHRIPKSAVADCGPRISLTYRRLIR
jgi:hypothetical protein